MAVSYPEMADKGRWGTNSRKKKKETEYHKKPGTRNGFGAVVAKIGLGRSELVLGPVKEYAGGQNTKFVDSGR